ncbi:R3HC1 protein, partial [Polypterus senegalus]|nr:R3H and coiled-coil domain-containing protein 1 [Polypterus senegalus]XP_039624406.1 R3H and coiled-coil domain-containing protein 1 [Polypterus senegalus]MBN3290045.1 R3HC1 protein [Polypterus senegalus]
MEDLDNFMQEEDQKKVLLFPPLPNRLRYLIHRTTEKYEPLSTFSIGSDRSRRTVVCHSGIRLPIEIECDEGDICSSTGAETQFGKKKYMFKSTPKKSQPDEALSVSRGKEEESFQAAKCEKDSIPDTEVKPCVFTSYSNQNPSEVHILPNLIPESHSNSADYLQHIKTWKENFQFRDVPVCIQDVVADSKDVSYVPKDPDIFERKDSSYELETGDLLTAMTLQDQQEESLAVRSSVEQRKINRAKEDSEENLLKEIRTYLNENEISITNTQCDYSAYKYVATNDEEFDHIIEVYGFPAHLKNADINDAFAAFSQEGLKIERVDKTHALAVFSSKTTALQALNIQHPLLKTHVLSKATKQSKGKAVNNREFLQPVKRRPVADAAVAKRLIAKALGLQNPVKQNKDL